MTNTKEYNREYYLKNKEKFKKKGLKWKKINSDKYKELVRQWTELNKERSKQNRKNRMISVINFYSNGDMNCACCGEDELTFLTIDHINNNGAEHRRNIKKNLYDWLIQNDYPEGFQILCFNCNCGKYRNGGKCPHLTNIE